VDLEELYAKCREAVRRIGRRDYDVPLQRY
jgi:hypothetical protein